MLSDDELDLLAVAACCGDRFDPVLVCEAVGAPRIAGLRMLHRADRDHRLIAEEGAAYRFRHHLVQEGMHGRLPPALRAAYHTALAAAREARLPAVGEARDAEAYAIARHFLLGDQPARARPYVIAGLDHLVAQGETRRAARMARRALEALPEDDPALRARLLFVRARSLDGRVDPEQVLDLAREALAQAEKAGDDRLLAETIQGVGASLARAGRHPDAWPYAERSVRVAERSGDARLLSTTLDDHVSCLHDAGRHEEAHAMGERAIAVAREAGDGLAAGRALMTQAAYQSEMGMLDEARRHAEIALSTAHLHGDRKTERFALSVLGRMAHLQADMRGAMDIAQRQEAMGQEEGNLRQVAGSQLARCHLLLNLGDLDAAKEMGESAREVFSVAGFREMAILIRIPIVLHQTLTGNFGAALTTLRECETLLEEVPLKAIQARPPPRFASLLAWMGAHDEADTWIERGRDVAFGAPVDREQFLVAQAEATLPDARGDVAASAARYRALLDARRDGPMPLYVALLATRLGGLSVELDEHDDARALTELALSIAEPAGLRGIVAEARIWRELSNGGRPDTARVLLEREGPWLGAVGRIRMTLRLAERLGDEALRAEARALCEALIASAPEDYRARMRTEVPLYRDALA